jgi:peptidoglycan/LPS O-acetylase OafA/YrhL
MRLEYRREINGLKGIAIFSIIFYHLQIEILNYNFFKGGFVGIDIFFVISGYLITFKILEEFNNKDSFSLKYFFEKQLLRILPPLMFVIVVSLPLARFFLFPNDLVYHAKSIITSLSFTSNFYFHFSGNAFGKLSYFSKPLINTWTLSVLIQFYFFFSIFFLILFKPFRKYFIYLLIFVFTISLLIADWGSRNHPSFNFYVFPTRAWEVLAGSLLAYFEQTRGYRYKSQKLNFLFLSFGLLLIIYSILFFNDEMFHPSFYTLSPVIGTCLIIWFSNNNEMITRFLSTKLLFWIGLISYSLYLWHFPIFAFGQIINSSKGFLNNFFLIGITVILSILTYYLIEQPAKKNKSKTSFILTILIIIILFVTFSIVQNKGYINKSPNIIKKNLSNQPWKLLKNSNNKICHNNPNGCVFNSSSNKKIFVVGDSHMGNLIFNLKDRLLDRNYQFITSTFGDCIFYPDLNLVGSKSLIPSGFCNNDYFEKLKQIFSKNKNSIIIIGGRFPLHLSYNYFDNKEGGVEGKKWGKEFVSLGKYNNIKESFKNEVEKLALDNKIILIYPIPEVGWDPNKQIYNQWTKKSFSKNFEIKSVTTSYELYKKRTESSFYLLDSIRGKNIYRVYPHELFCNTTIKKRCVTHDDKDIYYLDSSHPSYKGSKMINDLILKEINKIEQLN